MTRRSNKAELQAPPWPTQAEFIRVWQTSKTLREVCSRLKMKRPAVKLRAWRYRNWHGVPLKELDFDPAVEECPDWAALAKYAAELVAPGETPAGEPGPGQPATPA
jgi:hypothetical protein